MRLRNQVITELDDLITDAERLDGSYQSAGMGGYVSPFPEHEHRTLVTAGLAAIARIAGTDSEYYRSVRKPESNERIAAAGLSGPKILPSVLGALKALRSAVSAGLLQSIEVRLRAAIHDDLLQQASDLNDASYHVAAMVLVSGVLENHLRLLCEARRYEWKGKGSISKYNNLLRDEVYPQSSWRRVQVVGDLRNFAAHGEGGAVNSEEVSDAIRFVLRLIEEYPE